MTKNIDEGLSKIRNKFLGQTLPARRSGQKKRGISEEVPVQKPGFYPQQLAAGSAQAVGLVRNHNEDALFSMCSTISFADSSLPIGIFIVADGMGGHLHGEIASSIAVRTASEILTSSLFNRLVGLQADPQEESLQDILEKCVTDVNRLVLRKAPGGGTTLTIAILIGDQLTTAHVGDSRAYVITPDHQFQAVTVDHSLVSRLVQIGEITAEEAAVHPQRNVLIRAIGQIEPVKPDIKTTQFPDGSLLLLCSDGLWGVLPQEEMRDIIKSYPDLSQACHQLVQATYLHGAPDNISAILARYN